MENDANKRVLFDYYWYLGDEAMDEYREEAELNGYDESELFEYVQDRRISDCDDEILSLRQFFDLTDPPASNPTQGNTIILTGRAGRWDGTSSGASDYPSLADALSNRDSVFRDCEIASIWEEDGALFMRGIHHDGEVNVEIRQLSDAGEVIWEDLKHCYDWGHPWTAPDGEKFPEVADGVMGNAVSHLLADETLAPLPRYAERTYDVPEMER